MRRAALAAMLAVLATAPAVAQPAASLDGLHDKPVIGDAERQQIRQWVAERVNAMVSSTDPERKAMVSAREAISMEARRDAGARSAEFLRAFGEEAIAALRQVEKKAVSPEARLNWVMTVAGLGRVEGVPILESALVKDPFPSSRYWAARGLAMACDAVAEKADPRMEQGMAQAAAKAFDGEMPPVTARPLVQMLGRFDHEKVHEILAEVISQYVQKAHASDPMVSLVLTDAVTGLERAYASETQPAGKARILAAYATMCAAIMPPVADRNLMPLINASLEKITGEKVNFSAADEQVAQKLALLEWVEKFVSQKKIPKRPALPQAVEDAVKQFKDTDGALPAPAPPPAPAAPAPAAPAAPAAAPAAP